MFRKRKWRQEPLRQKTGKHRKKEQNGAVAEQMLIHLRSNGSFLRRKADCFSFLFLK